MLREYAPAGNSKNGHPSVVLSSGTGDDSLRILVLSSPKCLVVRARRLETDHSTGMGGGKMNTKLKTCAAAITALFIVALTPLAASATFPGDNGRIIFNRGSFEEPTFLASMEPDGSDETRLTGRARSAFGASWDPDGSRFIYSRLSNDGEVDLFTRDADGSNQTRVTDTNRDEFQVAFGPDGNQAVYEKCGFQCDLFKLDLTTLTETRLTDTRADEVAPNWSVDDVIVFERSPRGGGDIDVFSMDPDGSNQVRLTDNQGRQDVSASWSPDGEQIVYSRCGEESNCDLFTMNADGSNKDRVTDTRADEFGAKFSPNGLSFVVTRSRGEGRSDLFRMRTDGSRLRRLTDTPNKFEIDADWQPIVETGS
jgi:dipeptidyl aminopeptidase/acylaminoacyl peptidase